MQHAQQGDFKSFDASAWHIGLVVAQFNKSITDQLKASALQRAEDYKLPPENITVLEVAGAIEIPLVLQQLARSGKYNALLATGCIINGATPHFDYVCKFVTEGILRVQLDANVPIGFGILTCDSLAQAEERAHLGGDHLDAVMNQALVLRTIN